MRRLNRYADRIGWRIVGVLALVLVLGLASLLGRVAVWVWGLVHRH